jgi:Mrp family chromosome partitioning ATPase
VVLDAGDGTSSGVVAANLAAVLADNRRRVLLLDANTRSHGATRLLGLEGQPGYTEIIESAGYGDLNGEVSELRVARGADFHVLPRGSVATTGLLNHDRAQRVLLRLLDDADLVIVSAPSLQRSPAALVWAQVTDGTLLVVEDGQTSQEQLSDVLKSLSIVEANIMGTILGRNRRIRVRRPTTAAMRSEA